MLLPLMGVYLKLTAPPGFASRAFEALQGFESPGERAYSYAGGAASAVVLPEIQAFLTVDVPLPYSRIPCLI